MLPINKELGDQPKLIYENPTKELDSPIRLIPDEGNKENIHILESDDDEEYQNTQGKKARMEYSSPEKIEMFDNLSPIKIDTEGETDEQADERAAVMDIQRSIKYLRSGDDEEVEDVAYLERERAEGPEQETTNLTDCENNEGLQSTNEIMSPVIVRQISEQRKGLSFEDGRWDQKFSDLSERIQRKNHEIRLLNTEVKDSQNKINEITEDREKWELMYIQLEKDKTILETKIQSNSLKLQEYDDLRVSHEKLKSKFESCKQKLKEVKIEFNMLTQNNQILTDKFEKEYAKFTVNENLVNEWKTKYDSVNNAYAELKKDAASISENLTKQGKTLENKDSEIDRIRHSLSQLQQEFEDKRAEWDDRLRSKDQEISTLTEKVSASESKGSNLVSSLQSELSENHQSLLQKGKELEILQAELESKESENQELALKLETLATRNEENISKFESAHRDLESLKSKNGNIEAEHLSELESLHENMSQMETNMKENIQTISELMSKISKLEEKCKYLEGENNELKLNNGVTKQEEKLEIPSPELDARVVQLEKALQDSEKETNKKLQLLAEDLYIQYSSKHEQKVRMLKKGYETKYQDLLDKLTVENTAMKDEVKQLQHCLETERQEKQDLIKALE